MFSIFKPNVGKLERSGDIQGLIKAVTHRNREVVRCAVSALRAFDTDILMSALVQSIQLPLQSEDQLLTALQQRYVSPRVSESNIAQSAEWAAELLGAQAPDKGCLPQDPWNGVVSNQITTMVEDREADVNNWIIGKLQDGNPKVRETCALLCGIFKLKSSTNTLLSLLEDNTKRVQMRALLSLAEIAEPTTSDRIIEAAVSHSTDNIQGVFYCVAEMIRAANLGVTFCCAKCKSELERDSGYSYLIDAGKVYCNASELAKGIESGPFGEVFQRAVAASAPICLGCMSELSADEKSSDNKEFVLPTYLGESARLDHGLYRDLSLRGTVGNEHCVNCTWEKGPFSLVAANNGVEIFTWLWICQDCWHAWWFEPEIFAKTRPTF